MKKLIAFLIGIALVACFIPAQAEVLSDRQLSGIWAGQFDTDINDDVTASNSAVASQKNIGVIGSTDGAVSETTIDNINNATVNNAGDSAVALQANIAAISGLGTELSSDNNSIANSNNATVNNEILPPSGAAELAFEGSTDSGSAGINSMLSTVSVDQSAAATQNNIGAIVGAGGVAGASISNTNAATVNNGPGGI